MSPIPYSLGEIKNGDIEISDIEDEEGHGLTLMDYNL